MAIHTPNPLIPQGTFIAPHKGRAQLRIVFFTTLAVHIVFLGALLLQGCKRTASPQASATNQLGSIPDLNAPPPPLPPFDSLTQHVSSAAPGAPPAITPESAATPPAFPATPTTTTISTPPPIPLPSTRPETVTTAEPAPAVPAHREHKVQRGDTFSTLATKYRVSVKAIADANPNADPRRLKPGQTLLIPASAPAAPTTTTATQNGNVIHMVQSGDSLWELAQKYGVTVQSIRTANNLKTDRITVSQKLIIPSPTKKP